MELMYGAHDELSASHILPPPPSTHTHYFLSPVFPSVTLAPTTTITSGSNVTLNCNAAGNPQPFVHWFQNTAQLSSGGRFIVASDGSLTISNVALRDAGNYSCMATNTLGSASATTVLAVLRKSSFVKGLMTIYTLLMST